jgi:hypothetical protein
VIEFVERSRDFATLPEQQEQYEDTHGQTECVEEVRGERPARGRFQ